MAVGEAPPPDGDDGGGGEEGGGGLDGVDGDSEREGDGEDGAEGDAEELSEVDALLLPSVPLLDASAKTVATGVRLIARIKIAETIFSLSLCWLEKIFVCMTPSRDASRLPWNRGIHEEVIPFFETTLINSIPVKSSQDAKLRVCKAQTIECAELRILL